MGERGEMVVIDMTIIGDRHQDNMQQLKLTQKEFSMIYHTKLQTLRNWEQNKRTPDIMSLAYLTCIAKQPMLIRNTLESM